MATVYIETSIISHASSRLSADANIAALQIQALVAGKEGTQVIPLRDKPLLLDMESTARQVRKCQLCDATRDRARLGSLLATGIKQEKALVG